MFVESISMRSAKSEGLFLAMPGVIAPKSREYISLIGLLFSESVIGGIPTFGTPSSLRSEAIRLE